MTNALMYINYNFNFKSADSLPINFNLSLHGITPSEDGLAKCVAEILSVIKKYHQNDQIEITSHV